MSSACLDELASTAPAVTTGFAQVALPLPVDELFDYAIPTELEAPSIGARVEVPFGPRASRIGFCVGLSETSAVDPARIRPLLRVIDPRPIVAAPILELTRWLARYYQCAWGEALEAAVPGGVKKGLKGRTVEVVRLAAEVDEVQRRIEASQDRWPGQARVLRLLLEADGVLTAADVQQRCQVSASPLKTLQRAGLIRTARRPVAADPLAGIDVPPHAPPEQLSAAQQAVLTVIAERLAPPQFGVVLLHGVTGSGKTEVYLQAIARVLASGGSAIVLIPEISLTPQTVARFRARFDEVAILHSGLTGAQRNDQWRALREGRARVAIGPRSAVFAPLANLQLIVVDEEHEPSYKQQSKPRYHARDVAVMRARIEGAVVLLGSATPALESYHNAGVGKYQMARLPSRVTARPLPPVHIIDMTVEHSARGKTPLFSRPLRRAMQQVLDADEQVILFLNRRGFSTYLHCPRCESVLECERCSVAMTYHRPLERVVCHHCLSEATPPDRCPTCGSPGLRYGGLGTQRLEVALESDFPGAPYARMDSDTMVTPEHYDRVLRRFGARELRILCGTQMIAKGLDFPGVTLVGVLSADVGINLPDFRAAERTFQLIAQVAGRAGRGERPGRVFVQTRYPEHYAIQAASRHDYAAFVQTELAFRREMGYPPYARLIRVVAEAEQAEDAARALRTLHGELSAAIGACSLLGPAPAPIERIREQSRCQLLIKAPSAGQLAPLRPVLARWASKRGKVSIMIDVDPTSLL